MDLPFLKNDITTIVRPQKPFIYSRYLQAVLRKKTGPFLTLPSTLVIVS